MTKRILLGAAAVLALFLAGCGEKSAIDKANDKMQDAAEDAGDAAKDVGKSVQDALGD